MSLNPSDTPLISSESLDPAIMQLREHITGQMDKKTMLDSITDTTKLITGPLIAIGCSTLIAAFATATQAAAVLIPCGIGLLLAGGVSLATSIATSYYSTQINRKTSFDRGELDRMRAAHHLVEALRDNNLCITEDKTPTRNWSQTVKQETVDSPCQAL